MVVLVLENALRFGLELVWNLHGIFAEGLAVVHPFICIDCSIYQLLTTREEG